MSEADRLFFMEQMDGTVGRIGEMIKSLKDDIAWMKPKVARIDYIEQDIATMKLAITETNKDLRETKMDLVKTNTELAATNREMRTSWFLVTFDRSCMALITISNFASCSITFALINGI